MTKKPKQSKKSAKSPKRTKGPAQSEDDSDTATTLSPAEAPQVTPAIPRSEVAVESQRAVAEAIPATPATASNPGTRSEAAKANYAPPRLHTLKPVLLKAPCCSYNINLWFLQVL